jgi:hypothetical protein
VTISSGLCLFLGIAVLLHVQRHTSGRTTFAAVDHYIETMSDGKKKAWDKVFHTLGYFDPKQNLTQDKNFRTVVNGDGLSSLILKKAATQLNGSTNCPR